MAKTIQCNWDAIGHTAIRSFLEVNLKRQTVAHAYIFSGAKNIGKTRIAKQFVSFLLCENYRTFREQVDEASVESLPIACGECDACRQREKGMHADYIIVEPEYDEKKEKRKEVITIKQVRSMQGRIQKRSFLNSYKVVLIPEAERLTIQACNSLLKTLEEPTAKTVLLLITTSEALLLPTVISRCQVLKFLPVSKSDMFTQLVARNVSSDMAKELSSVVLGRATNAVDWSLSSEAFEEYKNEVSEVCQFLSSPTSRKFQLIDAKIKPSQSRKELLDWLGIVSAVVRDVGLLKLGSSDLVAHTTHLDDLQKLSKTNLPIAKLLHSVETARTQLHHNIHPKFVLENIFID